MLGTFSILMHSNIVAGGYVVMNEKLPNYVVPDLTDFKVAIPFVNL